MAEWVDVDATAVLAKLARLERKIPRADIEALLDTANEGLRLTQAEVPHDEGTLQNSGTVDEIYGMVILGYHTPYAARLHEHPEYRFQKGRKGKYIEDPLSNNTNKKALGLQYTRSFTNNWVR